LIKHATKSLNIEPEDVLTRGKYKRSLKAKREVY